MIRNIFSRSGRAERKRNRRANFRNVEHLESRQLLAAWTGDIPNGTVWTNTEVQRITGNVHVPAGATLSIQPGTVVKFNDFANFSITVDGTLSAIGTTQQPIFFTSLRDDTVGGDTLGDGQTDVYGGQWDTIKFNSGSTNNLLDHVEVRYGGESAEGQVYVNGGPLALTNSTLFASARAGVRIENSNPTLTNILYKNNAIAASMDLGSNPAITGVTLTTNNVNALRVDGGILPKDGAWNDPAMPYLVQDAVTVPTGKKLAIAAGQVIKFRELGNFGITVNGTLTANGTTAARVYFTSTRDDTVGGDTYKDGQTDVYGGQWDAIRFTTGSTGNVLDHVEVRYGGETADGQVYVNGAVLALTNSTLFASARAGVRIENSNPTLTNIIYKNNAIAASMDLGSNPAITGVTLTTNNVNALRVDGGILPKDGAWNDPAMPYLVQDAVTVPTGKKLAIAAGQVIKFREFGNFGITVNGTLTANGTTAARVYFTSTRDDTVGGDTYKDGQTDVYGGQWDAIRFTTGSTGNVLDHVEVRYGGETADGQVYVNGAVLALTNSTLFASARAGVRIENSNPTLTNIIYKNNAIAASMDLGSNPAITGVTLTTNNVNALRVDGGILPKDGAWNDPAMPYLVQDAVTVPTGKKLAIAAGQVIKFRDFGNFGITVNGTLTANGTTAARVYFTSARDDTVEDTYKDGQTDVYGGQWDAIRFATGSTGNVLDHVEVRYGGETADGQVYVNGAALALTNSTLFASARAGVRIENSNPTLTNILYKNNAIAASMDLASNPVITGVTLTTNGVNALRVDGGALPKDGAWNDPAMPYLVQNAVVVPAGKKLAIAAGQVIKFRDFGNFGITVNGTLTAQGTTGAHVVFTSARDDSVGGDTFKDGQTDVYGGQWDAIKFLTGSTVNVLNFVEVRYGGESSAGAVFVSGAPLTLSNSTLLNSATAGVRMENSNPTLTSNVYKNNAIAASMDLGSNPAITGVTLTTNNVNALRVDGGTLPKNGAWDDPAIPYLVQDAVTIPSGKKLSIAAGQVVKFREFGNFGITVNGTLTASGTTASPVIFTSTRDDSAGGDTYKDGQTDVYGGQWDALIFISTSVANVLNHVEVRYAGESGLGAVVVNGGKLALTNSVIRNSSTNALLARNSATLDVQNNLIVSNSDTGIRAETSATVTAVNNNIDSNFRGILVNSASAAISRNRIASNLSEGIRVETGSTVTIFNNTIDANVTGVAANGVTISVVNNTIVNNQIGIYAQDNSRIVAANDVVAYQSRSGIAVSTTGQVDLRNNDVYNPVATVGNYEGLADPQGGNGNLSLDPRFFGRGRTGDYRLFQGSPAIDAGLSSVAGITVPSTDALGNARFDDLAIANTGTGSIKFVDIGAYERQSVSEPDADLQVRLDFAPTTVLAGDRVVVRWNVTNNGPNIAVGPWVDTVFLQTDSPSAAPIVVAQVDHPSSLAVGASYTVEAVVHVRALREGNYRWVVSTDTSSQVFEALLEGNNTVVSAPVALAVPTLNPTVPAVGQFASDDDLHWYKLDVPTGQNVRLKLDSSATSGRSELFVAQQYVPSPTSYDLASAPFAGVDTQVDIVGTTGATYYILVRATGFGVKPVAYQLSTERLDFALSGVNRSSGGNAGQVTLTITGQVIPADAKARLVPATGPEIVAIANHWVDATTLVATFDLTGKAAGQTNVAVVSGSVRRTLTNAFRIENGGAPDFFLDVIGPGFVRIDRQSEFTITWGNRGSVDAPVQLVDLRSTGPIRVDRTPGGSGVLGQLFLAMSPNAPTPVIPAGDQQSIKVYVTATDLGNFTLDTNFVPITNPLLASEPIDFNSIKAAAKPAELSNVQWDTFYARLKSQLGNNWGTFAQRMAADSLPILQNAPAILQEPAGIWLRPALLSEIAKAANAPAPLAAAVAPLELSAAAATEVSAAAETTGGQVRALIVAVSSYRHHEEDLPGSANDLGHAYQFLTHQAEVPYSTDPDKSQVTVLSDRNLDKKLTPKLGELITMNEMQTAVRELAASAQPGDTLVVHYSGHGVRQNGSDPKDRAHDGFNGAFQLNSSDPKSDDELYNFRQFLHDLGDNTKATRIVIIADNCYSGGLVEALKNAQLGMTSDRIDKFTVVSGSRQTETTVDADDGGAFSTAFYAALQNSANDKDHDGFVSLEEGLQAIGSKVGTGNGLQRFGDYIFGRDPRGSHPDKTGTTDLVVRDSRGGSKDKQEEQFEGQGHTLLQRVVGQSLGDARTRGGSGTFRGQAGRSRDPNDKNTTGFGDAGFVQPDGTISYVIHFENVAEPGVPAGLTLPAQEVVVTDPLPGNLDLSTVELTAIGFGNTTVDVPAGRTLFESTAFTTADPNPVSVQASLNRDTGVITWTLRSFDIQTGLFPDDPRAGFLPVNGATHRGEGFVSFRARPKTGLTNGASFTNTASIVFDTNAPIVTNTTTNTIDAKGPSSSVTALPATNPGNSILVKWSGTDDTGGSGIGTYDVFVSDNGGAYKAFTTATAANSATYTGVLGHTYRFYSVATDNVGHRQTTPTAAQATTKVVAGDTVLPTAVLTAGSVSAPGTATYTFTVRYSDNAGVNVSTLGTGDLTITGPNSFSKSATFVSVNTNSNGTPRTATYSFSVPNGGWRTADAGTYTISMVAGAVKDINGNAVVTGALGTFHVSAAANISVTGSKFTNELGGTATFSIVLPRKPTANVVINLTVSGGTVVTTTAGEVSPAATSTTPEATLSKTQLTFTPANWNVPQTVTATGADSSTAGFKTYAVHAAVTSTDPAYASTVIPDQTLTNITGLQRVYNLVNTDANVHFYTTNKGERDALVSLINNTPTPHHPWQDDGASFKSFALFDKKPGGSNVGYVQRLYNSQTSEHYYTTSLGEATALSKTTREEPAGSGKFVPGWIWENRSQKETVTSTNSFQGYMYLPTDPSDTSLDNPVGPGGTSPVFRLYQIVANAAKHTGDHTLTDDPAVYTSLRSRTGWTEHSMVGFAIQISSLATAGSQTIVSAAVAALETQSDIVAPHGSGPATGTGGETLLAGSVNSSVPTQLPIAPTPAASVPTLTDVRTNADRPAPGATSSDPGHTDDPTPAGLDAFWESIGGDLTDLLSAATH